MNYLKYSLLILFFGCSILKKGGKEKFTEPQKVKITTVYGDMVAELYNSTPLHRDNFLKLADEGYYDSLLFHRVINKFMIQGGDPDSKNAPKGKMLGLGGPDYTIPAEFRKGNLHYKGALAAARTGGPQNPEKRSSGSQFYIVHGSLQKESSLKSLSERNVSKAKMQMVYDYIMKPENEHIKKQAEELQRKNKLELEKYMKHIEDSLLSSAPSSDSLAYSEEEIIKYVKFGGAPHLDYDYTVFGQVIEGLNIIDSIASKRVDRNNRPEEDIVILKIERIK